jgi:hypothetical protein
MIEVFESGVSSTYLMSSVEKFTMVLIKFSLTMIDRMAFQSGAFSPSSKQIDSKAILTAGGGLAMERTSTKCCFLMDLTAVSVQSNETYTQHHKENQETGTLNTRIPKTPFKAGIIICPHTYEMSSVLKFTIVGMKLSFMMMLRSDFQSRFCSPRRVQMDSSASLTAGGGLGRDLISTKCCLLMPFTATCNNCVN